MRGERFSNSILRPKYSNIPAKVKKGNVMLKRARGNLDRFWRPSHRDGSGAEENRTEDGLL